MNDKLKAKVRQWGLHSKRHLDQFNQRFAQHSGLSVSAAEMLMIAMVWALIGVMLVNAQWTLLPWLTLLGWLGILVGMLGIVASLLASIHEKD